MNISIVGIDPGKTGAIVIANRLGGDIWFDMHKMPIGSGGLREWFKQHITPRPHYAYIELVGGFYMPKNGDKKALALAMQRVSANLKLRQDLGRIEQACVDHNVAVQKIVQPAVWQKYLCPGLPKGTSASSRRKKEIHSRVLERITTDQYGNFKTIPLYAADAFGICLYGTNDHKDWSV